jgi:hypothetical protein
VACSNSDGGMVQCYQRTNRRSAELMGAIALDSAGGEGMATCLAFVVPPRRSDVAPLLFIGTSTGCLLLIQMDGVVVGLAVVAQRVPIVSIDCSLVPNTNPNVFPAVAAGILVTASNGQALLIPLQSLSDLPRVPMSAPRPKLSDPPPKRGALPLFVRGLATWCASCELWTLRPDDNGKAAAITAARLYYSRSCPAIIDILAPTIATERRVIVSGSNPVLANYLMVKEEGAKSAGELVAAMATQLTTVAVGLFRGFLTNAGDPAQSKVAGAAEHLPQQTTPLAGSAFSSLITDPSHRFAAGIDSGRNRVNIVDLETMAVVRVLKGCRAASAGWVADRGVTLLGIYLASRGVFELYSPWSVNRVGALSTPTGCKLATDSASWYLYAPDGELLTLHARRGIPKTPSHASTETPAVIPSGFTDSPERLVELIDAAMPMCLEEPSTVIRLVRSIPLNLTVAHLSAALNAVLRHLTGVEHVSSQPTAVTLETAKHFVELYSATVETFERLSELQEQRDANREESTTKAARSQCQNAHRMIEDHVSAVASAQILRTMRREPHIRSLSRITIAQFVNMFTFSSHRPRLKEKLTGSQKAHLAEALFAVPNGHPRGSSATLRVAIGITDEEAVELYLQWLAEKFNFAAWTDSHHFQLSVAYLRSTSDEVIAAACRRASAQEDLVLWLCVLKFHIQIAAGKADPGNSQLLLVIEQASTIHHILANPCVPPCAFDIETAAQVNLFVALCSPFTVRMTTDADSTWLGDISAVASVVSSALGVTPASLIYGLMMHIVRVNVASQDRISAELIAGVNTAETVLIKLEGSLAPNDVVAAWAFLAKSVLAPLSIVFHRRPSHASLAALISAHSRRDVIRYLNDAAAPIIRGFSTALSTHSTSTEVTSTSSSALFRGVCEEDLLWRDHWSTVQRGQAAHNLQLALMIVETLFTLLKEPFPDGDGTVFPWHAMGLDALTVPESPQNTDHQELFLWIEKAIESCNEEQFHSFERLYSKLRLEPADFIVLLQLQRHLLAHEDENVMMYDLPRITSRKQSMEFILAEIRQRVANQIKTLASGRKRSKSTAELLNAFPTEAREWLSSAADSSRTATHQFPQSTYELACIASEDEDMREVYPWLDSLPAFVASLVA